MGRRGAKWVDAGWCERGRCGVVWGWVRWDDVGCVLDEVRRSGLARDDVRGTGIVWCGLRSVGAVWDEARRSGARRMW